MFSAHNPLVRMGYLLLFQVPGVGTKGGLIVACKFGTDAKPFAQTLHQISFKINSTSVSPPWLVTCAHAPTEWHARSYVKNLRFLRLP